MENKQVVNGDKKTYHTPAKLVILGGIDEVVQSSVSTGSDGHGALTAS